MGLHNQKEAACLVMADGLVIALEGIPTPALPRSGS
jgi:hypothetical protein